MKRFESSPALIFNWIITGVLVLLVISAGFGIYFAQTILSRYVTEADHVGIDAEVIEEDIRNAKKLTSDLDANAQNIERAAAIVAESKSYQYQDQIVNDINGYASTAGVSVLGIQFGATADTSKAAKSSAGLNTVSADIILLSPMPYDKYLHFVRLIEKNLTKMQITSLNVSNDLINKGMVTAPSVKLEVYTQ